MSFFVCPKTVCPALSCRQETLTSCCSLFAQAARTLVLIWASILSALKFLQQAEPGVDIEQFARKYLKLSCRVKGDVPPDRRKNGPLLG